MPDRRKHRGPHPSDVNLFSDSALPLLRAAITDLSWLLTRNYTNPSALKLVGDRYQLTERQRTAILRCSCSDQSREARASKQVKTDDLNGKRLAIDGFNLITTIEVAFGGGVLIPGRDGCLRDMASMHGTWRCVEETRPALRLIGDYLSEQGPAEVSWLFDRPVSNSGRLAGLIREVAGESDWNWSAELHDNPDRQLMHRPDCVIVTADSLILDHCDCWWPLADYVVRSRCPNAWIADLS